MLNIYFRILPILLIFFLLMTESLAAQDKSASTVVQLPSAGGTVTREEGSFSLTNNTGSANFRLPLPELPQRGRFGPTISLTYNQFAGDSGGGLGVGWGFTVPSIMVNQDLGTAIPGTKPNGDFFSRLSYMGARLIYLGEDGGLWRYRPEFSEEYVEILYHPQAFEVVTLNRMGEHVSETLSSGFEVVHPDGSRMIFSGNPAVAEGKFDIEGTTYVTRWPLVMHLNANRDVIRYIYEKHGGRSYLSEISFAGGRSVYDFELIDTKPSLFSHVAGMLQQNAKLYGKVTSRFDDTVYGQWCFGYIGRSQEDNSNFQVRAHSDCLEKARQDLEPIIDASSINVLDQLRMLYRYGDTDGAPLLEETLAFPAIAFDYSSWTASELANRNVVFEAPGMSWAGDIPARNFELADLNMDALVDVVRSTDDGATIFSGEGDLNKAFSASSPLILTRRTNEGQVKQVSPRLADDRFHFADIFGDSYVDIIEIEKDFLHIYDGKADGSFSSLGRSIPLRGIAPSTFADGNGRFQDINLDGKSDIILTQQNADGKTEWKIFLNLTRRQADGGHQVNFGVLQKPFPFESQDRNVLGQRNTRLTDINGDRLPDFIVIRPADKGFCLYENQGNIFSTNREDLFFGNATENDPICGSGRFSSIEGLESDTNIQAMWYVDANGDGIMDFASMGNRTDQLRVWLGFGDGTYLSNPLAIALNLRVQIGANESSSRSRVSDLDADGQSEIIVFQASGGDVRPVVVIDFNRTETMQLVKANLLTTVDFTSGRRHDIRYASSIDEMLRDRANGLISHKLHFPVVVAKQMVTSEGVPGQIFKDVQTEEFFYHNPFYDMMNKRFIGFAAVDKVTYGDEFAEVERITQQSSIVREQYYTFAETTNDLHLAGKLKVRKTYEMLPEPELLAKAEATINLDPTMVGLHSLSTATRGQSLPEAGRLLSCEDANWQAISNGDGSSYLRKVSENLTSAAGEHQQQGPEDPTCVQPTKTLTYANFDDFNMHGIETVLVRDIEAPLELTVPGYSRTTKLDFVESRAALAPLGIVNVVSERHILSGPRLLSLERFTYLPERGGRLGSRALEVFSSLKDVPDALADLHNATHTLAKSMKYDVFGNIISMADDVGQIEAVSFEETGTLPLSHTLFSGRGASFDQVTNMVYDGPRAGGLSRQITPLGVEIIYEYDSLGRKIIERADDGAEKVFRYRLGKAGKPSLILTSKRRYLSDEVTPKGESQWIEQLAAYTARGNQLAEIENVAEGGVRVFNFSLYNRNAKQTFRWTPFVQQSFENEQDLNVRKVFEIGKIPRPVHEIGNAYTYDAIERMVHETHPSGKKSQMFYEPWGTRQVTTYDDQFAGNMVTEEWRLSNENGMTALVVSDGQGANHIVRFIRDAFGYLSEVWLPGETIPRRFTYNSIGDMEHQDIPGMGEYFYFYDQRGRQSAKIRVADNEEMKRLTFTYDFLNRKITESEDGKLRVQFTYDEAVEIVSAATLETPTQKPLNKITQIVNRDPNGLFDTVQRFGYDRNGRMVANEIEIAGKRYGESFHHTLDGRIDSSTGPRGLSSKFSLGPDKNLRSVTINHADFSGPENVIENISYNAEGRIHRIDYRHGAFTQMTYHPETLFLTRIVSSASNHPLQDLTMTFNGNGSITEIVDALTAADSTFGHVNRSGRFGYDFKNQLVNFKRYGIEAAFSYSASGTFTRNDEFETGQLLETSASASTRLLPAGSDAQPYAFDGFGQMARSPKLTGTVFDAYGRLIRAQTRSHDVFYGYNQTGRRLYKRIVPMENPDGAELYLFPLETFEVGPKGEESFVNIGSTRLVRMEHGLGRWYYYLKDHLDSSDYVMASNGVPVEQMLYRAYGTEHQPETLNPAWGEHLANVSDELPREKTHHRFTGQYLDDDTGLYYYGARYYDPKLARFISPDPLYMADPERCTTRPTSCNLFAYANNNPMAFIDPTGLDFDMTEEAMEQGADEELQRLDPTARIDQETGEISQSFLHGVYLDVVDFFIPGSGHDAGRELTSRLIESEQTTTIQYSPNAASAGPADPSVDPRTTPADVIISYDPSYTPDLTEFDPSTGSTSPQAADPAIILGHEMIHATHRVAGQHAGWDPVNYTGLDGSPQSARNEEARTVGVGGTTRPDDITENDLREMMGINPRNHY